MARNSNLRAISVYVTEAEHSRLSRAATLENRSLSNFLLNAGAERATAMNVTAASGKRTRAESKGTKNAGHGARANV